MSNVLRKPAVLLHVPGLAPTEPLSLSWFLHMSLNQANRLNSLVVVLACRASLEIRYSALFASVLLPLPLLPTLSLVSPPPSLISEYNVGLALLRLGKIMSTSGPDGSANPAVDCRVLGEAGQGEAELRRCLPLTPPWWPVDLDPATGKVPA